MEPLDVRNLVIYGPHRHGQAEIVGVREFHVAKALLEGHQEELSQLLPSQWGMVHLFDLCLWFGLIDTASALAFRGVEGCILEDHHNLGPFSCSRDSSRDWVRPFSCHGWDTCEYCCWAFPVKQGIWMEDWDQSLYAVHLGGRQCGAIPAAEEAAAMPLTRAMLDIFSCDMELPFSASPQAMARLLDIAILTGNQKAALNLSKKSHLRPLRRWVANWNSEYCWKAATTALWAGADFQDLMVKDRYEDIPFPQALFLKSKLEDWNDIRHLLPQCHDLWRPRNSNNDLGKFFLEGPRGPGRRWKLSLDKILAAEDAGVDVRFCCVPVQDSIVYFGASADVTFLDMAIWSGQPHCAEACVDRGIELKDDDIALAWHKQVLSGESLIVGTIYHHPHLYLDVVPSEAQTAAAAAGRTWLKRFWKSESSQKGIVLYQFMLKMFKGRPFPMALVEEILTFSMPVPKIVDQLDLCEHVGDWMASIASFCGPFAPAAAHDGMGVKIESAGLEGPSGSDGLQQCSTAEPETAAESGHVSSDAKSTDELMMALQASRDEIPALNIDGVCLFRLTRFATSAHVSDLLLNPSGPLASLHNRVLEAGCQVDPEWNPVKVLFIPITEAQVDELMWLAEQGYELNKEDHILALQEDEPIITEALRSHIKSRYRPRLKKEGQQFQPDEDVQMEENDPLLVRESGLRTDSSLGFPSYSG